MSIDKKDGTIVVIEQLCFLLANNEFDYASVRHALYRRLSVAEKADPNMRKAARILTEEAAEFRDKKEKEQFNLEKSYLKTQEEGL